MSTFERTEPTPGDADERLAAAEAAGKTVTGSAADVAESILHPGKAPDPDDFRFEK